MNNHFEYNLPKKTELQERYITPYRFSKELRSFTHYIFTHPTKNKHRDVFIKHFHHHHGHEMLKHVYLKIRYFQDFPQQFGHSLENITADILVGMWKSFLANNKYFRGAEYSKYLVTDMKMLTLINGRFLDIFLQDIKDSNFTYQEDVDRSKRPRGYSEKLLDYYDTL